MTKLENHANAPTACAHEPETTHASRVSTPNDEPRVSPSEPKGAAPQEVQPPALRTKPSPMRFTLTEVFFAGCASLLGLALFSVDASDVRAEGTPMETYAAPQNAYAPYAPYTPSAPYGGYGNYGYPSDAPAPTPPHPRYQIKTSAPLHFTIPLNKTTMITAEGDELSNALYDNRTVEVHKASDSGRIFVMPLVTGPVDLFLATRSGGSIHLALNVTENAQMKNIILAREDYRAEVPNEGMRKPAARTLTTGEHITDLKRALMAMEKRDPAVLTVITKETPSPEVATIIERFRSQSPLKPHGVTLMGNDQFTGTEVTLLHTGTRPVVLDPSAFTRGDIDGAAVDKRLVRPGETVTLYVIERY